MKALSQKFYDETARIEELVLLAGVLGDYYLPPVVEDFLEEGWPVIEGCFGDIPSHVKADVDELEETDALLEWLLDNNKLGFLLRMATPIMRHADHGATYYSWGSYSTKWFYGETLEAALDKGFAWVAKRRELEKSAA
ncbi:MAG: hypothetical protein PHO83_03755 [Geobacteraceae bacterium]|nr:hypothetical protein [Geobacteraceae bacterium]